MGHLLGGKMPESGELRSTVESQHAVPLTAAREQGATAPPLPPHAATATATAAAVAAAARAPQQAHRRPNLTHHLVHRPDAGARRPGPLRRTGAAFAVLVYEAVTAFGVSAAVFTAFGRTDTAKAAALCAAAWTGVGLVRRRYAEPRYGDPEPLQPLLRDWFFVVATLCCAGVLLSPELRFPQAAAATVPCVAVSYARRKAALAVRRRRRRRLGLHVERVLLVGDAYAVNDMADQIARYPGHSWVIVGACLTGPGEPAPGLTLAGRLPAEAEAEERPELVRESVLAAARSLGVETVFVIPGGQLSGERLRQVAWAVQDDGRRLAVLPGLLEVASHRLVLSSAAQLTLLHVEPRRAVRRTPVLKTLTDLAVAALLLAVLLVPLLLVGLAVAVTSRGPVLYRQVRLGRHGRPFTMLKFRTMIVGADRQVDDLSTRNENDGAMFKIRRDPRVTRIGRLLRRYSVDELPQLLNVVRGHMSLVGPRPPLPDEVAGYGQTEWRRLLVRPGLTGLWQVSGRSDLSWDETVELDLRYVDNWTYTDDLRILVRTCRAVLGGRGAY